MVAVVVHTITRQNAGSCPDAHYAQRQMSYKNEE